jgi:hypothetical protein
VARELAAQSDRVASAIEANDGCAATERVRELERSLADAAARGDVPQPVRVEVERLLDREFVCIVATPPAPQPQAQPQSPPAADDDDDHADDHGKRGKGKKRGKKHGHDKDDD